MALYQIIRMAYTLFLIVKKSSKKLERTFEAYTEISRLLDRLHGIQSLKVLLNRIFQRSPTNKSTKIIFFLPST